MKQLCGALVFCNVLFNKNKIFTYNLHITLIYMKAFCKIPFLQTIMGLLHVLFLRPNIYDRVSPFL